MRRKRKARHAFSGKPVPNPLPRAAFVGKSQAISESGAARPGDSQGRDLTHERVGGDQRLARVPSGASNFRFESPAARRPLAWSRTAGERHAAEVDPSGPRPRRLLAGPWARRRFFRKRPEYPVSGTNGSNPSSSSGESSKLRRRSLPARLPCLDRDDGVPLSQRRVQRTPLLLADLSYSPPTQQPRDLSQGRDRSRRRTNGSRPSSSPISSISRRGRNDVRQVCWRCLLGGEFRRERLAHIGAIADGAKPITNPPPRGHRR